ncbi:two-component sensor histidine kinase [Rhizobium phaseoli]|uniref:histidine kinase n=1 Tax=Rhizobium phaseoli TaxID=396 RepID=A0A7K3UDW6_9HYPH|nr:ATP-binding protein [Rhizobium phaseoli]NEJ71850.1 two-component sensor histidine kinase [Rhizobium phaseoli]
MSLRRSFILVFSALLTALAAFAAAFSYYSARLEAWSILDFQLQQIAHVVGDGSGLLPLAGAGASSDEIVAVRITFADGRTTRTNDPRVVFPPPTSGGFSTFRADAEEWRLFTDKGDPARTVMVAQRTAERDELAADAAWNSAWPFLLAIPLSWLAAYWLVGAIMERLHILAGRVENRVVEDIDPLSVEDAPVEVRPLVLAINRAFDRVRATLEQQRAFLADAAHELRTPVTALSLQIDNLRQAGQPEERDAAVADLEAGVRRATQVATQLLRLARSESGERPGREAATVHLGEALQECLGRFLATADAKAIDLGMVQSVPCLVRSDPAELAAILDVVVDNALRYTADHGQVDLAVLTHDDHAVLSVTDNGPGIPAELRERVFDRFYRIDPSKTDGSGLGLAIARNLAGRYGGAIRLMDNPAGRGLRVVLEWPLA